MVETEDVLVYYGPNGGDPAAGGGGDAELAEIKRGRGFGSTGALCEFHHRQQRCCSRACPTLLHNLVHCEVHCCRA